MGTRDSTSHLAGRSGVAALSEAGGLAAEYLAAVIVTRSIGAGGFGVYTAGRTTMVLLVIAGSLGLRQGVVRHLALHAGRPREQARVILAGLALSVGTSLLLAVGLWAAAGALSDRVFRMPDLHPLLGIYAIAIPLYSASNVLIAALAGMNQVSQAAVLERAGRSATMLLFTVTLAAVGLNLPALAYRDLLVGALGLAAGWWLLARIAWTGEPRGDFRSPAVLSLLTFSLPLLAAEFVHLIMLRTDVIVLATLRSGAEVGVFSIVTRIAWVTVIPLSAIDASTFPALAERFGRKQLDEVRSVYTLSVRWALLAVTPVAVMIWVFARDILRIFGAEFSLGIWALRLLVTGFWLRAALGSVSGLITMGGRSRLMLYNTIAMLLLNTGLNFTLIQRWGIEGAAVATGGITALSGLAMSVEGSRLFGVSYQWGKLWRALVAGAVAVVTGLVVDSALRAGPVQVRVVVAAAAVTTVLVGGTLVLGLWHPEDRALLSALWRRVRGEAL